MICFLFMVAEVIGGYLSNSVAIMTDAAHMLSDCSGFIISILSINMVAFIVHHSLHVFHFASLQVGRESVVC